MSTRMVQIYYSVTNVGCTDWDSGYTKDAVGRRGSMKHFNKLF